MVQEIASIGVIFGQKTLFSSGATPPKPPLGPLSLDPAQGVVAPLTRCLLHHLPNTPPAATAQDAALLKVLYYFISQTARCISLKEQFIIKHCVGCWGRGEMSAFVNCFRGRVVRALDSQSAGHGFESYRGLYQLVSLFVSFTLTFLKKTTFFCFFF